MAEMGGVELCKLVPHADATSGDVVLLSNGTKIGMHIESEVRTNIVKLGIVLWTLMMPAKSSRDIRSSQKNAQSAPF